MKSSARLRPGTTLRGAKDRIFWAIGERFAKSGHATAAGYAVRWHLLELLNIYRLLVAAAAIAIAAAPPAARALQISAPLVVGLAGLGYLLLGLAAIAALAREQPSLEVQAQIEPLADLLAAVVFVQATGADLGILAFMLIVPVTAAAAALRSLRSVVFFAALAALTVLAAAIGTQVGQALPVTVYTEAGLFGLGIFALALITHALAIRLLESETLAARRGMALRELDAINRRIIAQLRTGVAVTDANGDILRMNPAAAALLDAASRAVLRRLAGGEARRRTHNIETTNGGTLILTVIPLDETESGGRLVFVEDANAAMEQAQSLKLAALGRLTAGIAHQVRNPLAAIAHANQLLAETPELGDRESRLVDIISHQSTRLDGVVGDILSLSRRGAAHSRNFDLNDWLGQFADVYRERQPERAHHLHCEPAERAIEVRFDPGHLEHIAANLVDNAFVHADSEAGVKVRVGSMAGSVYLDVLDRGPGIAQPDRLFEPFATTRAEGTGLGLYLARELAAANGARLAASPRQGGGTRLRLEFAQGNAWLE